MSTDNFSGRDSLSYRVISKYFSPKPGMDESLTDFQEKKSSCTGPKSVSKPKVNKIKKPKHIKGQRDIRTLVKSKTNELVRYTKDFDQICKHAGIDIHSEQLQLAIALSKSLQDSECNKIDAETETVKPLTAQERSRKIKSTLKEYGFKVPSSVIKNCNKKAISNKNYKLLLTPDTEKNQITNSKYAEVLRSNPTSTTHSVLYDYTDKEIYLKTTNISYSNIKNVKVFYIPNLIETTTHKTCLLKDWSEIPGRPISPDLEISNFKFDEFEFTQDELDCILSHPLQLAQEIIKEKRLMDCDKETVQGRVEENLDTQIDFKSHNIDINDINNEGIGSLFNNTTSKIKDVCTTQRARSVSPDLFDEDEYSIVESANDQTQVSEIKTSTIGTDKMSFMDLTECVSNASYSQPNIVQSEKHLASEMSKKAYLVSNGNLQDEKNLNSADNADKDAIACHKRDKLRQCTSTNIFNSTHIHTKKNLYFETVREINDVMEVTECVISEFNQPSIENIETNFDKNISNPLNESMSVNETIHINTDTINLIKLSYRGNEDVQAEKLSNYNNNIQYINISILAEVNPQTIIENIDLTQTTDEGVKHFKEVNDLAKNHIDDIEKTKNNQEIETDTMDLTQSSNSNEDLPMVQLPGTKGDTSSDDTIVMYDDDASYNDLNKNINMPKPNTSMEVFQCLTQETPTKCISHDEDQLSASNVTSNKDNIDNNYIKSDTGLLNIDDTTVNIDLTQSPESTHTHHSNESLGKLNNISIDYDDLYDNMISNSISEKYSSPTLDNLSKNTDILETECAIIDDEGILNCSEEYPKSLQKEIYTSLVQSEEHFGCISNINDLSNEENTRVKSKNDSYLPNVNVKSIYKDTEMLRENSNSQLTPSKFSDLNNKPIVQTPVNDQYIIKTDNVTPILDYESMTTPARNKELEKYGIKPFKRKRAIQLLTYLYNQTHPIVEQCVMDEMPSTSKKLKIDEERKESKKTSVAPKKTGTTNCEEKDMAKENNLYIETKEHPDIKEIDCCPEEWVFQTREKAKVHSCRVPLHIAFHNYVSCRNMLRAAILRYEPINIDIIHKDLIASGFRYNPKELLKFMDKKCITVKTTENNTRNKKI